MIHRIPIPYPTAPVAAAALMVALAAAALGRGSPPAGAPRSVPAEASAEVPATYLSLSTRASRGGAYRAAVVERRGPGAGDRWVVRVARADGTPVEGAALRATPWMPDAGVRMAPRALSATELSGGLYRIDGLRFTRAGWWTVPVRIGEDGRSDRVVFNLIVPANAVRRAGRGGGA